MTVKPVSKDIVIMVTHEVLNMFPTLPNPIPHGVIWRIHIRRPHSTRPLQLAHFKRYRFKIWHTIVIF